LVAIACLAVMFTDAIARGSADATRRIQRDIGTNLVILPGETDISDWWMQRPTKGHMPQGAVDQLETAGLAGRLIPVARGTVALGDNDFLLVGIGQERAGGKRSALAPSTSTSGAIIGAHVANALGLKAGSSLALPNGPVDVVDVLLPEGSLDDISVFLPLGEVQQRLGLEGRLTQIDALECRCGPDIDDPLAYLQHAVATILPHAQVIRREAPAEARRKQRALADATASGAGPAAALVAMCIVAGLAWLNVRDRRTECGVLRALGWTRGSICVVLLGRWFVVGLSGAIIALGLVAMVLGVFHEAWWWSLAIAPVAAVVVGSVPAMIGAGADPVEALRT
jgi:hypothetical protein